jgi:hypothetical protein
MLRQLAPCSCFWWRWDIPLTHRWTCTGLNAVTSQESVLFNSRNFLNYVFWKFFAYAIASTAGLKMRRKSQLMFLCGAMDTNITLWNVWNGRNLALTLINDLGSLKLNVKSRNIRWGSSLIWHGIIPGATRISEK